MNHSLKYSGIGWGALFLCLLTFCLTFTASAQSSVKVRVQGSLNGSLAGIKVYAFDDQGVYTGLNTVTDTSGETDFSIEELGQGSFSFRADYLNQQYFSDLIDVGVSASADILINEFTVTVEAGDSNGALPGINTYLFDPSGAYLSRSVATDGSGKAVYFIPEAMQIKFRGDYMGYQFWTDVVEIASDLLVPMSIASADRSVTVNSDFQSATTALDGVNTYLFKPDGAYLGQTQATDVNGQAVYHLPDQAYKFRADYQQQQFFSDDFQATDPSIDIPMAEAQVQVQNNGDPVSDIPVYVFTQQGSYLGLNSQTNANGECAFMLPAGTYKFRADYLSNQYWSTEMLLVADQSATGPIDLNGGQIDLQLTDGNGQPLTGVQCYAFSTGGQYLGLNTTTDDSGQVSFILPEGTYRFRADLLGYQFWSIDYPIPDTIQALWEIPHHEVDVEVYSNYQLQTTPLDDVSVYLFSSDDAYLGVNKTTDAQGLAAFWLPVKTYKFRADYVQKQYWSQSSDEPSVSLEIPLGSALVTVNWKDYVLTAIPVYAFTDSGTYLGLNGTSDNQGQVNFSLPVGDYKFRADFLSGQYWSGTETLVAEMETGVEIYTGGATFDLTVVKDPTTPLEGVRTYLFNDGGIYLGMNETTDENGLVQYDLPEGTFRFRVDLLGYQFWAGDYTVPDVLNDTFAIAHQDVTISVLGTNPDAAIEGARVYLFSPAGSYLGQNVTSDASGQAVFNLPDQEFKARVDYMGRQYWSAAFRSADTSVVIPHGQLDITVNEDGQPAAGVRVYLFSATGSYLGQYALTDVNGLASFNLPAGEYLFRADINGQQYWTPLTTIGEGETQTTTIVNTEPTITIQADPTTITLGETATLTWVATDAYECSIAPDIGEVDTAGSMTVSPSETTTYTITAIGTGGTVSATTLVTVNQNNGSGMCSAVSAGDYHSLAVLSGGTLWAWGANWYGQIGDGTTDEKHSPVQIGSDNDWVTISAGYYHSLAVRSDGTLWAWGDNWYGQLGDGTNDEQHNPVQIGTDTDWVNVSAGEGHNLAIKADGTLWAWGSNFVGQLGDGTSAEKASPIQIGGDTDWAAISAGYGHSLAVKSNGTLWVWGMNSDGQLGDGTTTDRSSPLQVGTDTSWVTVASGGYHSLALKSDGTLWAWGANFMGQLGDGTTTGSLSPIQVGGQNDWVRVSAGFDHGLGIRSDGSVWAWGYYDPENEEEDAPIYGEGPVRIGEETGWVEIASGGAHSFALKSDGALWAWGANWLGQLGDDTTTYRLSPVRVVFPDISDRDNDGLTDSEEDLNGNGIVDAGETDPDNPDTDGDGLPDGWEVRHQLDPLTNDADQDPDGDGLTNNEELDNSTNPNQADTDGDGLPDGWEVEHDLDPLTNDASQDPDNDGLANSEELEHSTNPNATDTDDDGISDLVEIRWCTNPVDPTDHPDEELVKFQSVSAGEHHSLVVRLDGTLWAWGTNWDGQLGDGTTEHTDSPVQSGNDTDWVKAAAGYNHSLAIKSDGSIWAWGENGSGRLGDGTTTDSYNAVQIGSDTGWVTMAAGHSHNLAIKSDGTLWAWGSNSYGQLGDGTDTDRYSPIQVGSDTDWLDVSVGYAHSLALKSDGSLWAWGNNYSGQLGDGTTLGKQSPVQIEAGTAWKSISAVWEVSHAIRLDGTLWAWGYGTGESSDEGEGGSSDSPIPLQIGMDTDWERISARFYHNLAIRSDGTLWAWGGNEDGQLGDGTTTDRESPVKIGNDINWSIVTAERDFSLALKSDGTLWGWGENVPGQAGDSNTIDSFSPIPIVLITTDRDNDGLNDTEEDINGNCVVDPGETNYNNPDTDGDGLSDSWEIEYGLDPTVDDAEADPDGDGLINRDEWTYNTHPNQPDTDGDGIMDSVEIRVGADPNDPASLLVFKYRYAYDTRGRLTSATSHIEVE